MPMAAGPYGSITANSVYRVLSAVVPLYVAVTAGYLAVKFRLLSAADIAGINRFVVLFAIPVLSFRFIAGINLYKISYRLIVADTVFKLLVFGALALYGLVRREADLGWMITLWMVTTLSNTLIVGVPTLVAMYGPLANDLIGQVIVGQAVIWYPGLMLLYEIMASQKEERSQAMKGSLEKGGEPETRIELDSSGSGGRQSCESDPARTPRTSSDEALNAASYGNSEGTEMVETKILSKPLTHRGHCQVAENGIESFNPEIARGVRQMQLGGGPRDNTLYQPEAALLEQPSSPPSVSPSRSHSKLELQHLTSFKNLPELDNSVHKKEQISSAVPKASPVLRGQLSLMVRNQPGLHREASRAEQVERWKRTLKILGWKLRKSFTVHAALLGLVYSLVAYKAGFDLPLLVRNCADVLADTGIGMSMFSLGMFMGSTAIFPCSFWVSLGIHFLRFLVGPALMGTVSFALGLRGDTLRVAILQAALPQAVVSFSFAKEYNAYPEVLSTSITFGTLVSLPVALIYYVAMAHV